jgi:tetratricopeptide (TPR) repeat protein
LNLDTASMSIPDNKHADDRDQKPAATVRSKNGTSNGSTDHNSSSNTLAQQQQQQQQPYFPVDLTTGQSADYLSLRRQQNRAWADERLHTGIQLAQQNKFTQAEKAYQQGLDLVPNHVDLMVAAAALHANQGTNSGSRDSRYHQTRALQLLEQALREDPHHANAAQYQREIQAHQQKQQLAHQLAAQRPAKADRAMQDASLERSFEIGHTTNGGGGASASAVNNATAYPLLGSDSEHDRDDDNDDDEKPSRKHKKRKHKKRHKKKSKRHHRHRRRSSSYYDSNSDTDDNDNRVSVQHQK